MAQWLRRLPTEQEIPGSSPGVVVFECCFYPYFYKTPFQGNGMDVSEMIIRERDMALNELRKLRAVSYLMSIYSLNSQVVCYHHLTRTEYLTMTKLCLYRFT